MSPEDLAKLHPRLFHVTEPGAWAGIREHGLLSSASLLTLFKAPPDIRDAALRSRRPLPVPITHPVHGCAVLNDNIPLTEKALSMCLDDGLLPEDWLGMLNTRVFFWPDEASVQTFLGARFNRGKRKEVLAFDTLSLARAHSGRMELCPINSGATIRKPARRGLATFTPLAAMSYAQWRAQRGGRDTIREVTVRDGIPDIASYLLDRLPVAC